jgi:Tfp pilus assembly protein PilO
MSTPTRAPQTLDQVQRQTIMRCVVALGIAVLAWQLITRSQQTGLSQARASLAARQEQLAAFAAAPATVADLSVATQTLKGQSKKYLDRLAITADTAKLYESIGNLALRQQLRMERIDPLRTAGQTAGAAAKDGFEMSGYSMEVVGTYDGVARFLDQLQNSLGVTRIESLRIEPAVITGKDGSLVRATIETQHLRLPPGGLKVESADQPAKPVQSNGGAK